MTASAQPIAARRSPFSAEVSYILPMAAFLLFTAIQGQFPQSLPIVYPIKTIAAAALLIICWPAYTKIDLRFWWVGAVAGVVGVVEWIALEKGLLHIGYPRMHADVFNPMKEIANPTARVAFIVFRWAGPTLVVPLMEERFWRDYLWRSIIAPNDFKLAAIGEWDFKAFAMVTLFFASVHLQWITAIVWGAMIAWVLIRTRSLGACIVMHAVTNFLLGAYVLWTHDWYFW